jgi:hypothetical protein
MRRPFIVVISAVCLAAATSSASATWGYAARSNNNLWGASAGEPTITAALVDAMRPCEYRAVAVTSSAVVVTSTQPRKT